MFFRKEEKDCCIKSTKSNGDLCHIEIYLYYLNVNLKEAWKKTLSNYLLFSKDPGSDDGLCKQQNLRADFIKSI